MKTIKAVIIEDEAEHLQLLSRYLKMHPSIEVANSFTTVKKSIKGLHNQPIDLLFLDVELPDGTGFEVLETLNGQARYMKVIFTTGYNKYAVEAIRASAFDFLVKPINEAELAQCIERVLAMQQPDTMEGRIKDLLYRLQSSPKIRINTRTGFLMISIADIIYCEADGNYTVVHYKDWKKELSTMHLGLIEMQINHPDFLRVSRSLLINTNYLYKVDRKDGTCLLEAAGTTVSLALSDKSLRVIGGMLG